MPHLPSLWKYLYLTGSDGICCGVQRAFYLDWLCWEIDRISGARCICQGQSGSRVQCANHFKIFRDGLGLDLPGQDRLVTGESTLYLDCPFRESHGIACCGCV